jgi:hypothetical protein
MMSAAVAAFHRHLYRVAEEDERLEAEAARNSLPVWKRGLLQPNLAGGPGETTLPAPVVTASTTEITIPKARAGKFVPPVFPWQQKPGTSTDEAEEATKEELPTKVWNRLGILDFLTTAAWLYATVFLWQYAIEHV